MKKCVALLTLVSLLLLPGCGGASKYKMRSYYAMDTPVEIKINRDCPDADAVLKNCGSILKRLDNTLSKTKDDSDVGMINRFSEVAQLSDDTVNVIKTALEISEQTFGMFDITTEPLTALWKKCGEDGVLPDYGAIDAARSMTGYKKLTLDGKTLKKSDIGVMINLGGIAKGYAADVLRDYLISAGASYGIISFGSTVAVFGEKPGGFKIGIKDPSDPSALAGYVYMTSGVLSVTGDYERFVEIGGVKYHHVIDPRTGYPAQSNEKLHSVAVVCEDGAASDALSTALFISGSAFFKEIKNNGDYDFEAVFMGDNGIVVTDGLADSFEQIG